MKKTIITRTWLALRLTKIARRAISNAALCTLAICALLFPLLASHPAQAQLGVADVLGTVTDPSGAVIPNAKVTVKNLGTSEARTATTSDTGEFIVNLLPNGRYSIEVKMQGFKTYSVSAFTLSAGDRARFDAKMETGSVEERVEVTDTSQALQTDNSTVTSTVSEQAVQDLPLNGRNFVGAIQVQPGVNAGNEGGTNGGPSHSTQEDWRSGYFVVANGQSDSLNNNLIDGFDNNERLLGIAAIRPSLDGIAEMAVDTNAYNAQFGRTAGAVINIVTKSGTNTFHGSAFDYLRNDIFDAPSFNFSGATQPKPEYRMNEFGGSVGGPIRKDKTFFFADIEEDRIIQGLPEVVTVPTVYEEANPGDLSDVGGPDLLTTPGVTLDPIALKYFALYPAPTNPTASINNYAVAPRRTQYSTTVDARVDQHFTANDLFFARYAYNPSKISVPNTFPLDSAVGYYPGMGAFTPNGWPGLENETAQNLQLDYVHIFSPSLLMDLKAAYTRFNISQLPWNYGLNAASKMGIPNVEISGMADTNELPLLGSPSFPWGQLGDSPGMPLYNTNNTYQYSGSVTYTRGTHNIKVGAGLLRRQLNVFTDNNAAGAVFFFGGPPFGDPRADFFVGAETFDLRAVELDHPGFRSWEPSVYAQDDWRATSKLTLNLGVRYDIFTPFTEAHGQYANFDPGSLASGIGAQNFILGSSEPTLGVKTDYKNVAPRIGFAYSVLPKTVVRGGFGMSFLPADVGESPSLGGASPTSIVQNFNPPYAYSYQSFFHQLDTGLPIPQAADLATYATNPNVTVLSVKPSNLRSQYAEQLNLFLQREFGASTLSLGYVGVLMRRLDLTISLNQPDPPCLTNPDGVACGIGKTAAQLAVLPKAGYIYADQLPFVSAMLMNYNGATSAYHAMQLNYTLRSFKGIGLNANYTWSHGTGDGNECGQCGVTANSNPKLDYGNSPYDIRQRLAVSANYALPIGNSLNGVGGVLLKGWQVNGISYWQTGLPFTITDQTTAPNGAGYSNQAGVTVDRPDLLGPAIAANPTNTNYFNLANIIPQTQGTQGDERINQLHGPHDRRTDLSLLKDFAVYENWKLQFRAECFNISNTPNFDEPEAAISQWAYDPTGTTIVGAAGGPFGGITNLAANENPRQIQFALKLLF